MLIICLLTQILTCDMVSWMTLLQNLDACNYGKIMIIGCIIIKKDSSRRPRLYMQKGDKMAQL